jgi:hypothetical protein
VAMFVWSFSCATNSCNYFSCFCGKCLYMSVYILSLFRRYLCCRSLSFVLHFQYFIASNLSIWSCDNLFLAYYCCLVHVPNYWSFESLKSGNLSNIST